MNQKQKQLLIRRAKEEAAGKGEQLKQRHEKAISKVRADFALRYAKAIAEGQFEVVYYSGTYGYGERKTRDEVLQMIAEGKLTNRNAEARLRCWSIECTSVKEEERSEQIAQLSDQHKSTLTQLHEAFTEFEWQMTFDKPGDEAAASAAFKKFLGILEVL